jgi:hypothetical protein
MPVYVDIPFCWFGRMRMCHMTADSPEELHAMADRIGVARKWFQDKRTKHYDICLSKRRLAIRFGAVEMTKDIRRRQLGL